MNTKKTLILAILVSIVFCLGLDYEGFSETQEHIIRITVKPNTIGMPGNKAWKVPLKYARIRSTELRNLIKSYDINKDATIEKVFEWKEVGGQLQRVEVENTYIIRYSADKVSETSINELVVEQERLSEVTAVEKTTVSTEIEAIPIVTEEATIVETEIIEEVEVAEEKPGTRRKRRTNRKK